MSYPSIHWIFLSAGRPSLTTCNRGFMLLRGSYQATNNSRVYAIKYVVNIRCQLWHEHRVEYLDGRRQLRGHRDVVVSVRPPWFWRPQLRPIGRRGCLLLLRNLFGTLGRLPICL